VSSAPHGGADVEPLGALEWDVARRLAFDAVAPLAAEHVGLSAAIGRVLVEDVLAAQDVPHYASSAMDGWAIAGEPPWHVGTDATGVLHAGEARGIVTGGVIPPGTDAVLRTEHARLAAGVLTLAGPRQAPTAGADIRPAGEEAHAGDTLILAGTLLNPAHIAVAASCARDLLAVTALPRVALLLTGDEVVETGLPPAGRVRDSFGPQLPALIAMLGGTVVSSRRVSDRRRDTVDALDSPGAVAELIITTGGTGSSAADQVRGALAELDAELLVPRLATRPGGPTLLARLPDGRLVVGLAGNPLAAITGLLLLVGPLMAGWSGRPLGGLAEVRSAHAVSGHERATLFVPYRDVDGRAIPSAWGGSGMMRGLAESAGILIVPPAGLEPEHHATALTLPWAVASTPAAGTPAGDSRARG